MREKRGMCSSCCLFLVADWGDKQSSRLHFLLIFSDSMFHFLKTQSSNHEDWLLNSSMFDCFYLIFHHQLLWWGTLFVCIIKNSKTLPTMSYILEKKQKFKNESKSNNQQNHRLHFYFIRLTSVHLFCIVLKIFGLQCERLQLINFLGGERKFRKKQNNSSMVSCIRTQHIQPSRL